MARLSTLRTATIAFAAALSSVAEADKFPWRGVNLGGWLVAESWMYPTWWNQWGVPGGSGEFQFCQQLGMDQCKQALSGHWDTWFSQAEINELAAAGITHVRIPIGFWILGEQFINRTLGETYVTGGWFYLERLLQWCHSAGIQAVIDLHGAPGSQNGHDNSGSSGPINWTQPFYQDRTLDVLSYLAKNLTALNATAGFTGVISGIEVLNEPWTTNVGGPIQMDDLKAWLQKSVDAIRTAGWGGYIWIPDGWNLDWSGWQGFLSPPQYQDIVFDTHVYHAFGGPYANLNTWQQIGYTCRTDGPHLSNQTQINWNVVGEWSLGLPDAVTPDYPYDADATTFMRSFAEAQMDAYGDPAVAKELPTKGWFMWSAKTEDNMPWSYLQGLKDGYIPDRSKAPSKNFVRCDGFRA